MPERNFLEKDPQTVAQSLKRELTWFLRRVILRYGGESKSLSLGKLKQILSDPDNKKWLEKQWIGAFYHLLLISNFRGKWPPASPEAQDSVLSDLHKILTDPKQRREAMLKYMVEER